ncbi:MAG: DsbA family protein [Stackebrandtia sp.]
MAKKSDKKKEAARIMREQQKREARRKKILLGGGITLAVLLLGGVIGLGLWLNNESFEYNEPKAEHTSNAIVMGDGPIEVDVYEDFMCPSCGQFEKENGQAMNDYVVGGNITLNYHPITMLDRASQGTAYSSRAAAAAVCAADEDLYLPFAAGLYSQQPAEGSEGLTDKDIIGFGTQAGLTEDFASCVEDEKYRGWVEQAAEENQDEEGFEGTPWILIDGEVVDAGEFGEKLKTLVDESVADAEGEGSGDGEEPADEGSGDDEATKEDDEESAGN